MIGRHDAASSHREQRRGTPVPTQRLPRPCKTRYPNDPPACSSASFTAGEFPQPARACVSKDAPSKRADVDHCPTSMAFVHLENAGITTNEQVDFGKNKD